MPESSPGPEFEEWVRAAIISRLAEPDPTTLSALRSELLARAAPERARVRPGRARLAFAAGAAVVLISFCLFVASPRAAAAVRHWLGFIPGLGLVNQGSSWQVLTEAVSQTRSGVELTVEAGSSDPDRTILLIKVDGMQPPLGAPSVGEAQACVGSPELIVAGEPMPGVGQRQEIWDSGYAYRLVFPPMPTGESGAELRIPCLLQVLPGAWPEDWVLPLTFQPGVGQPIEPVYEPRLAMENGGKDQPQVAAAGAESHGPAPTAHPPSLISSFGILSDLEGVVRHPDGLTFFGSTSWTDPLISSHGVGVLPMEVSLTDINGRDIPIEPAASDGLPSPGDKRTAWAFHISESNVTEPLTLTFGSLLIDLSAGEELDLDLGPDPKPGQTWSLDRHIKLGEVNVQIVSAQLAAGDSDGVSLKVTLRSDSDIVRAFIYDRDHPEIGGGGGGGSGPPQAEHEVVASVNYPEGIHGNQVHLSVDQITILVNESSSFTWTELTP